MDGVVIGREREIAVADGFLDAVRQRARGLLLVGEPGIGKTTIWSAVIDEATRRGFTTLVARPSEAETELAFAVLSDLFATVDDADLGELPDAQRTALEHALRRSETETTVDPTAVALGTLAVLRQRAAPAPLLIAVDDLQWVDAPSLRALTFAFRRLAESPAGLIATVRTGYELELTRLAERDGNAVERVEIGGLGRRDLSQLLLERTERPLSRLRLGQLARLSGGSPYYALELAASDEPGLGVPENLTGALRARLGMLSDAARAAGLTAALVGRFDAATLAQTDGAVDELRAAGVVDERTGDLWFAHPLLASTLLEMHTREERRDVHLALTDVLDDPDERAIHLGRGIETPSETVALELEAAAVRLDARGAPETAAILAERAAALTPPDDVGSTTRRLLRTADLYQAAGEGRDHVLPLLEDLVESLMPGADRARVLMRLGWLGAQLDSVTTPEAIAYEHRALEESEGVEDVEAAANAVLARLVGIGGDYDAGLRHAELAVAAGSATASDGMFPSPSGELGIARFLAGKGLDEQLFDDAIEHEATTGRAGEPYQSPRLQLGLAWLYSGQLARARSLLDELLQLSIQLERIRSTAGCLLHLVELETRAGDIALARRHLAEFVHLDRQLRGELSEEWYPSGLVAMHFGRKADARRILTAGIGYSEAIESTIWLAHHRWALGHLELSVGNLDASKELLVPLPAMLRATGLGEWAVHPVHPDAIEVLVGLGDLDLATELADELEEYGRRLDRPWGLATAGRSRALIAAAGGDNGAALGHLEAALEEHGRLDWPLERARTLLVTGGVLRRAGHRRDAAARLEDARSILAAIGNPLWLARVDAEESRLGGRRRSGDALTPAEERVATLAADGLRNAEIASQLFVTPKTVEATLSRVYRKLGIRSRTELARRLAG